MKTIKQIATEIGVSRQTVYNKIKKEPLSSALQGLTEKVDKTLHINFNGIELIKSAFNKETLSSDSSKKLDSISQVLIETLQQQITVLTSQLEVKDEQILKITEINKNLSESINADRRNELAGTLIDGQQKLTKGEKAEQEKKSWIKRLFMKKNS